MKRKRREGNKNLIGIFGVSGLLTYCFGVVWGYLKGFSGDHRAVRWAGRALPLGVAFAFAFTAIDATFPVISQFQKNGAMDTVIAQTTEEEQDTGKETLLQQPIDTAKPEPEAESEIAEKESRPLDNSVVEPSDIYAEKGSVAVFKAYHPKAKNYQWEIYNEEKKSWQRASKEMVSEREDELRRNISILELESDLNRQVRCRVTMKGSDPITYMANLYILAGRISAISADNFTTEAKQYADAGAIPLKVTYQDGSEESIRGLSGLFFLQQTESYDHSDNMTETITTVRRAHEYAYITPGRKEQTLCYHYNGKSMDIPITIIGLDQSEPQIRGLTISDFEVSNTDQAVPVTITIKAEDNVTPLRQLVYAFLPAGEEPKEEDWTDKSVFQTEITKNGTWKAYCRDAAGNIATKEQEIIAVDRKPPVVQLNLEKDKWCQQNKIFVSAEDSLSVEYRYFCEKCGKDSGWVSESSMPVGENGLWKVQVRDTAGNIGEQEILIDNIDAKAPVIRAITEKSKGETMRNEE